MTDDGAELAGDVLYWPPGTRYPDSQLVSSRCTACGQAWRAHRDLAGSSLACRCGATVKFELEPVPIEERFLAYEGETRAFGDIDATPGPLPDNISTSLVLEPGALTDSGAALRSRWTTRTLLELTAVMAAFLAPSTAIHFLAEGEMQKLLEPVGSLIAALLVLAIGATARRYTFGGLRRAAPLRFVEAVIVAAAMGALAVGYAHVVADAVDGVKFENFRDHRELLGLSMTLFVIGFCPAVFEELAFRGLLQGRLSALFGNWMGIFIASLTFALAHGVTRGFPFHISIGMYLGWLRWRSNSLLPGMLLHFVYNATIVLFV